MNRTELFEQIGAATEDDALKILSLLFYKNIPNTGDLEPDDIPSWQNVLDYAPAIEAQVIFDVVENVTTLPISIDYSNMQNPTLIFRKTGDTAISTGTTTATDGTFTDETPINVLGVGTGAKYTVITVSNVPTSIVRTVKGTGYKIGDVFTIAALPGLAFTVGGTNYGAPNNYDTGSSIVITTPDAGDGTSADSYQVIIKA